MPSMPKLAMLATLSLLAVACALTVALPPTSNRSGPAADVAERVERTVESAAPAPVRAMEPVAQATPIPSEPVGADEEAAAADAPIDDGASAPPDPTDEGNRAAERPEQPRTGEDTSQPAPAGGAAEATCDPPPVAPPGPPVPGRPPTWTAPLPPASLWNPPGPRRVGLQAGHWLTEQAPPELSRLQHGATGGGKQEWEVNLDLARRTKTLLEAAGVAVDLLPATVPPRYRAHAFVSIHADGDPAGRGQGFKVARPAISAIPADDDRLVAAMNERYAAATGLPRDDGNITIRMRYYYAFNSRRYCHAVAPGVPQLIVETGFLTSASDRALLLGAPDRAARGIAEGILAFLNGNPRP